MHRAAGLLVSLSVLTGPSMATTASQAEMRPLLPTVVVLGIDGLGSDNVWRDADRGVASPEVPAIERLREQGAWTLAARIDPRNFSGPNWAGMVTGSPSDVHGVQTNDCTRGAALPTIYEVLHQAFPERTLAVVHEWDRIACYYEPSSVGIRFRTRDEHETATRVIEVLDDARTIFTFVHFDRLDVAGHDHGGSSTEYKARIESIDRQIGRILSAIEASGRADSTWVILTADHGHLAAGGGHAPADAPTPFIVSGPGVVPGEIPGGVRNNQVAPLVARIFGVAPDPAWSAPLAPFDRLIGRWVRHETSHTPETRDR